MGGTEYAEVHLRWTIPPAVVLWLGWRRFRTRRDVSKIAALCTIAIVSTIPWDSYLIRNKTWITSNLYTIVTKPVIHALHLPRTPKSAAAAVKIKATGGAILLATAAYAFQRISKGGPWTYMCLIVAWAFPFLALLWGTWVIERGTKLGLAWYGLEIEEAIFFLLTNCLVVFGMLACDYCLAVHDVSRSASNPTLSSLAKTVVLDPRDLPHEILHNLAHSVYLLQVKSKSFYTGSILFEGRLKLDLLSLYAWCRVVDDMVDEPNPESNPANNIAIMESYLDQIFDKDTRTPNRKQISTLLAKCTRPEQRPPFFLLPALPISRGPLDELVEGFKTDADFDKLADHAVPFEDDSAILHYASNVASSVADLCCQLVWHHYGCELSENDQRAVLNAARQMGQALQLTNIARDVAGDLEISRVYLPGWSTARLRAEGLEAATQDRRRLLKLARQLAQDSRGRIALLPSDVQGGMRSATDLYMIIANAVDQALDGGQYSKRAGVGSWYRIKTVYKAMVA
ncbi:hypothetical protein OIO90_003674 [Microbotryomycetes sp. JL221]|nr:hypothetical protein OIO90_003674 [Microbotryomycetes sp. JL221]